MKTKGQRQSSNVEGGGKPLTAAEQQEMEIGNMFGFPAGVPARKYMETAREGLKAAVARKAGKALLGADPHKLLEGAAARDRAPMAKTSRKPNPFKR